MKRATIAILVTLLCWASVASGAGTKEGRLAFVKSLNASAAWLDGDMQFSVDPNDSTTFTIWVAADKDPKEFRSDWVMLLALAGLEMDSLKARGFNKMRLYTSRSVGISDYILKIL